MRRYRNRAIAAYLAAAMTIGCVTGTAGASEMENESAVAGMAINLNNYYASTYTPEADILEFLKPEGQAGTEAQSTSGNGALAEGAAASVAAQLETSASDLVADDAVIQNTGMISVLGYLYLRKEPSKSAESIGSLYSNCKVDIYDQVSNEEGDWYLVSADGMEGYVSSVYVRTGKDAEIAEANVTNKTAVIVADSLDAKDAATDAGNVVETVYKDERYTVVETQGDYVKISNSDYVIGYVPLDGVKFETQLPEALAAADTATVDALKENYLQGIDYTQKEYTKRLVAGDYNGALNAAIYVVELWGLYIDEARYAGLEELAAAAEKEKEAAVKQMEEIQAKADELGTSAPETSAPAETAPAASESAPAETSPAETLPSETAAPETGAESSSDISVVVPTMAPVVTQIEARYQGGTKREGEVIYSSEVYIHAVYSDGSEKDLYEGWTCPDVGMYLAAGNKVVTMYYGDLSSVFELYVEPAPTTAAPTEAPTTAAPAAPAAPAETPAAPVVDPGRDYRAEVVAYATSWVGRCSYVWGGTTLAPGGQVDCSGFTMCVYRDVAGISLPHYSYSQRNCGAAVSYEQLRPGDLVLFEGHVGIYIGDGLMVHAKSAETGIVIDSVFYNPAKQPVGYRSLLP